MAKRNKKKLRAKQQHIKSKQQQSKPKEQLNEAARLFNQGKFAEAATLAQSVLKKKSGGETDARATRTLVESFFRTAAATDSLTDRVSYLDSALGYAKDDPRLHFHKGVALLRQGQGRKALSSFDKARQFGSNHPQLGYLRQLAQLSAGEAINTDALSPAQAGFLKILDGVQQESSVDALRSLVDAQLPTDQQALWHGLLKMVDSKTAAPIESLQKASEKQSAQANPLLHYYLGIAAMRGKEPALANKAWTSITGLESTWFTANVNNLLSGEILELGQNEAWEEVLAHASTLDAQALAKAPNALQEVVGTAYFHQGNQRAENQEWLAAVAAWEKANEYLSNRLLLQNLALAQEASELFDEAAESWRAMIKRRPRKESHPDYLSDAQTAAVWARASACYAYNEEYAEMIPCLKNAIKYDEENIRFRLALVEAYMMDYRIDAAINETHRVLEIDETNIQALERLGTLYAEDEWKYDSTVVWRRILKIDPNHPGARDALAEDYVKQVRIATGGFGPGGFGASMFGSGRGGGFGDIASLLSSFQKRTGAPLDILKRALEEIPEHPTLLFSMGEELSAEYKEDEARDYFYRAWQVRPSDLQMTAKVIIAMLIDDGDDLVNEMLPQIKKMHQPPSALWMALGKMAIDAELAQEWLEHFLTEAIAVVEAGKENTPKLQLLLEMYDYAESEGEDEFGQQIAKRIRKEEPNEGGPEYIEAHAALESGNSDKALRLIRKSISKLRKAGYDRLVAQASSMEAMLSGKSHPMFDLQEKLMRAGIDLDGPPPDPEEFLEILDTLDEETVNELRKIIGF